MVQRSTLFPTESPDTPDVGEVELSKIAVPEITDHRPDPTEGIFPFNKLTVEQIVWSILAFAVVGTA